ncbi:MAG: hypothetical protein KAS26_03090 [Sulfurimonas sp.]|nr:hypothetical protein [Sulfurimonas sp.]
MNEFIVWDKKSKKFRVVANILYNTQSIHDINKKDIEIKGVQLWGEPFNPREEDNPDILVRRWAKEFTIHNYIGKTDIEGNKIYADSSIVELRRIYRHFGGDEILKGFFTFNKETSAYDFISSDEYGNTIIHYNKNIIGHISNLKIIGTLQENRELLNN